MSFPKASDTNTGVDLQCNSTMSQILFVNNDIDVIEIFNKKNIDY